MIKSKYSLRYAIKKDFDYFYKGEEILYSSKAWALVKGRKIYALGGIWLMKTQNTAFVKIRKNLPKKEFWKVSKLIINQLKQIGLPIMCFRDETMPNSKNFLEKLGFKYSCILNNQEVYKL